MTVSLPIYVEFWDGTPALTTSTILRNIGRRHMDYTEDKQPMDTKDIRLIRTHATTAEQATKPKPQTSTFMTLEKSTSMHTDHHQSLPHSARPNEKTHL